MKSYHSSIFIIFSTFLVNFADSSQFLQNICRQQNSSSVFCQQFKPKNGEDHERHIYSRSAPSEEFDDMIIRKRDVNITAEKAAEDPYFGLNVVDPKCALVKILWTQNVYGIDNSCRNLKDEYDQVCFTAPQPLAFTETKAFCDAFVQTCTFTLKTNLFTFVKELKIDYSAYCKAHKERFLYVCPEPLRFRTFAEQAVSFCVRYKDRCPNIFLPSEPVPYKDKMAGHIYTREIEFWCTRGRRNALNYCTVPELLKVPKYALPCALYKYRCVDIYRQVDIYGGK